MALDTIKAIEKHISANGGTATFTLDHGQVKNIEIRSVGINQPPAKISFGKGKSHE